MKYLLLIYSNEAENAAERAKLSPEQQQAAMGEWFAYTKDLQAAGHYVGGDALDPTSTARSVRMRGGERVVTDGPFAETTEQLGGYYLVDVPDEQTALEWAANCPAASYGTIEVRPLMLLPDAPS